MTDDSEEKAPSAVALALLDYRVGQVEQRVDQVQDDVTVLGQKIDDIPGFIARKFEDQKAEITARGKTQADRVTQVVTASAAILSALVAAASWYTRVHQ